MTLPLLVVFPPFMPSMDPTCITVLTSKCAFQVVKGANMHGLNSI